MTRSVCVYFDAEGRAYAHDLAGELAAAGHRVRAIDAETFPVADSMTATLQRIGAANDLVVAVLSGSSRSTGWIAAELRNQEALYPNFLLAVAPTWIQWQGHLDESSFRVLAPAGGVVARVDEWLAPAPRPPDSPPLGVWLPFDPTWIVRTVRDRRPDRGDIARALGECTKTIWDAPYYQSFVGPKSKPAASPFKDGIVVKDHVVGLVSVHLGPDDRVSAIGYLDRMPIEPR